MQIPAAVTQPTFTYTLERRSLQQSHSRMHNTMPFDARPPTTPSMMQYRDPPTLMTLAREIRLQILADTLDLEEAAAKQAAQEAKNKPPGGASRLVRHTYDRRSALLRIDRSVHNELSVVLSGRLDRIYITWSSDSDMLNRLVDRFGEVWLVAARLERRKCADSSDDTILDELLDSVQTYLIFSQLARAKARTQGERYTTRMLLECGSGAMIEVTNETEGFAIQDEAFWIWCKLEKRK